jgi:uncharacterized membrane protein
MSIGPLQLVVIGFDDEKYLSEIVQQLQAVRRQGIIRLFDMLYIIKQADGTLASKQVSDLTAEEKKQFGKLVSRLIGLGSEGVEHEDAATMAESLGTAETEYGLNEAELQRIAEQIPNGSSAILVLFEHHWAVDLRQSIVNAGGKVLSNAYINPDTLQKASHELAFVLEAINRVEASAVDEAAAIRAQARAEADEAHAEAEAAERLKEAAEKAAAEAEEQARRIKQAAALEALSALKAAKLIAEEAEQEAMQALSEAELIKATAADEAAMAKAEAEAMEDAAFAQAEAVRRAAQRQEAEAIARAEEVVARAKELEATAVMKAIQALIAAQIVEEEAAQRAVDAIVAAEVLERVTAQKAADTLLTDGFITLKK